MKLQKSILQLYLHYLGSFIMGLLILGWSI